MREKILKAEIFLLFILLLTSVLYFSFQKNLPDHFMTISSNNDSINVISYGLTSIVVVVATFSGVWLIFPLIFFSILYASYLSQRSYVLDLLIVLPVLGFFLVLSHFFFPVMLGPNIAFILREHTSALQAWMILLGSPLAIYAACLRPCPKKALTSMLNWIKSSSQIQPDPETKTVIAPLHLKIDKNQDEEKREKKHRPPIHTEDEPPPSPTVPKKKKNKGYPPLNDKKLMGNLFSPDHEQEEDPSEEYFEEIIQKIEDKLAEFSMDAQVINILKGPVVDTFELELGEGVRVAKITSLSQDLSLALSGAPLRIIYPLEGKTTVGLEVPRNPRQMVLLGSVINSHDFQRGEEKIPLAMGKNSFGEPCVVDLTSMPHMLIAGSTGAGKSVFINTLLVSMLAKMPPEKLQLLLIDPKQLELALYQNLPHLVMPVITDASQATASLLWAIEEMERRYSILSKLEVRSIDGFNHKIKQAPPEVLSSLDPLYQNTWEGKEEKIYELSYLVIVIDEFADLILVKNGKYIENNICRLAAKARACGIHLIIATQRPSVDVITGLIKANFPTRVSFRVSAGQDSRTILNTIGAENLLGRGDMLYKHGIEMKRMHAAYVNDDQIAQLMEEISVEPPNFSSKAMGYLQMAMEKERHWAEQMGFPLHMANKALNEGSQGDVFGSANDPLYLDAVNLVLQHQSASASMIQRRLKVGYNRAANLIEVMENKGVVGPQQGSKPREVLSPPN